MSQRILIAVPVYNEAQFIGRVLDQLSAAAPNIPILVVNDGSTDGTASVIQHYNVQYIEHKKNCGKGEAIQTAFSFARHNKYDWIIFLDGDGQHPPRHISHFIDEIRRNRADVVLGNRRIRSVNMPFHRLLSNGITSILISLCAGQRIYDSQCGYRAVRVAKMRGICFTSSGFQVESEMLLKLGKTGALFTHVPIETVYGDESSSIHLVADTLKFIKLILSSFWW